MKLGKRIIVTAYRAGFSWTSKHGIEVEQDPDVIAAWLYLGFFGVGVMWCRDGWVTAREAAMDQTALALLAEAPDPQVQTPAFLDEWDKLEAEARQRWLATVPSDSAWQP